LWEITLNRFPLPLCDSNRGRMESGNIEKYHRAGQTMEIYASIPLDLSICVQDRLVNRFGGKGKAVRILIDIGGVNHELHVVHPGRMRFPVRAVSMPPLVWFALMRPHVPQADFAETDRPTHQKFNGR